MESFYVANVLQMLIIACATLGVTGIVAWSVVQLRKHRGAPQLGAVAESIERLRESVEGLRYDVGELAERLEFTERIMARLAGVERDESPRLPPH